MKVVTKDKIGTIFFERWSIVSAVVGSQKVVLKTDLSFKIMLTICFN